MESKNVTTKIIRSSEIFINEKSNELEKCLELKDLIKEEYETNNIEYVLIIGDFPKMKLYPYGKRETIFNKFYVYSDLFFTDFVSDWDYDEDDMYGELDDDRISFHPEVALSRIPLSNYDEIDTYFTRLIHYSESIKNKHILFASSFENFDLPDDHNECYLPEMDKSIFSEKLISKLESSFDIFRLYENQGIKSSKNILKSDSCLNDKSIIDYLNCFNPLLVSLDLRGDTKAMFNTIWVNDKNQNSFGEREEVNNTVVLNQDNINNLKNVSSYFSYQAPSLWQEEKDNLSNALLAKSGIVFAGYSSEVYNLDPENEFRNAIIDYWIEQYLSGQSIGESYVNTITYFSSLIDDETKGKRLLYKGILYSLSYVGDPSNRLDDQLPASNIHKPNTQPPNDSFLDLIQSNYLHRMKDRTVLPFPPQIKEAMDVQKACKSDPYKFAKYLGCNSYYCTKDGGLVTASMKYVSGLYRFCITKYNQDFQFEWEFLPVFKADKVKRETGNGAAFDVVERDELGGYLCVGTLEQGIKEGKDLDLCIITLDKDGRELSRYKYDSVSLGRSCHDAALSITSLKNGEFIVSGFQLSDGSEHAIYLAHLYPNGGIKNQCNRTVVITGIGDKAYKGPQPFSYVIELENGLIMMVIVEYETIVITNISFEELYLKSFFPFKEYSFNDFLFLDPQLNEIPKEYKGKIIFTNKNRLYLYDPEEQKVDRLKELPRCCECLNLYQKKDGIYLIFQKLDKDNKFEKNVIFLTKFNFEFEFLWKLNLNETLMQKNYQPVFVSTFFIRQKPELYYINNNLFINKLYARKIKNKVLTDDSTLIKVDLGIPFELRKTTISIASKSIYKINPIELGQVLSIPFRITNIGEKDATIEVSAKSEDIEILDKSCELSCCQSENISLRIDTNKYKIGKYDREILFQIKNSIEIYTLQIQLEIIKPIPKLSYDPKEIDFGTIMKNKQHIETVSFKNIGEGNIKIRLQEKCDWFEMDVNNFEISNQEPKQVSISIPYQNDLNKNVESFIEVYANDLIEGFINIKASFEKKYPRIEISSEDPAYNESKFDFGKQKRDSVIHGTFLIRNVGYDVLNGSIKIDSQYIQLQNHNTFTLNELESMDCSFSITCEKINAGSYSDEIVIVSNDKNINIIVLWSVLPSIPSINPAEINDETIIKGREVKKSLIISNIENNIIIKTKTNNDWIKIKDNVITTKSDSDITYSFLINSKGLPEGKYNGEIQFEFYFDNNVEISEIGKITVPIGIIIQTNKVMIEIWIGKNFALVNNKPFQIDKDNPSVVPVILSGTTMVPLRFVGENLGANIQWNSQEQSIKMEFTEKELIIWLFVNNKRALVNGKEVILNASPVILNGRVFVPIRFISESIGAKVEWEAKPQKITITYYI